MNNSPCEYCNHPLPRKCGTKEDRKIRSAHFNSCKARLNSKRNRAKNMFHKEQNEKISRLTDVGITLEQAEVLLEIFSWK